MKNKLTNILSIICNNRYNSYDHLQNKCQVVLTSYSCKSKFSKLFNDLLKLCKNIKHETYVINKPPIKKIVTKKIPQPVTKLNIKKIYNFTNNTLFNVIIKDLDLYMIKVNKMRYDVYSEIFMKAVDKLYCVLPKEESIGYLKKIKYSVIEEFNKKNLYKLYNYSPKNFKKSELDDVFGNNKPIKFSMLKIFADVFNCNLIYLENNNVEFITKFVDNLAVIIITEDASHVYCLRTKDKSGYIRAEQLIEKFKINRKLNKTELTEMPLNKLQNFSRMKNIDYKKQGKTKKINKTKQELIDELYRL